MALALLLLVLLLHVRRHGLVLMLHLGRQLLVHLLHLLVLLVLHRAHLPVGRQLHHVLRQLLVLLLVHLLLRMVLLLLVGWHGRHERLVPILRLVLRHVLLLLLVVLRGRHGRVRRVGLGRNGREVLQRQRGVGHGRRRGRGRVEGWRVAPAQHRRVACRGQGGGHDGMLIALTDLGGKRAVHAAARRQQHM